MALYWHGYGNLKYCPLLSDNWHMPWIFYRSFIKSRLIGILWFNLIHAWKSKGLSVLQYSKYFWQIECQLNTLITFFACMKIEGLSVLFWKRNTMIEYCECMKIEGFSFRFTYSYFFTLSALIATPYNDHTFNSIFKGEGPCIRGCMGIYEEA